MSHRLFVALTPPQSARDALIDTMEGMDAARWQADEQLHITLRFVGEVDTPVANDLAAALGMIGMKDFPVTIASVGHFARRDRAKAIWAAITPSPQLSELQHKVERACRAVGLAPETRKFVPHVTLARLSGTTHIAEWLDRHARIRLDPFMAGAFTLYESTLGKAGSRYDPVVRYPLG